MGQVKHQGDYGWLLNLSFVLMMIIINNQMIWYIGGAAYCVALIANISLTYMLLSYPRSAFNEMLKNFNDGIVPSLHVIVLNFIIFCSGFVVIDWSQHLIVESFFIFTMVFYMFISIRTYQIYRIVS